MDCAEEMDNSIQHRVFLNCIGRVVHPKITGFELVLDCPCLTSGGDFKVISSAFESDALVSGAGSRVTDLLLLQILINVSQQLIGSSLFPLDCLPFYFLA